MKILKPQNFSLLAVIFFLVFQSCTSVKLISDYDEITDNTVTQLQRNTSNYFVVLERTIGTVESDYENFISFFDNAKVDLNTLEIRTAAFEKNKIVQNQIQELEKMIDNLENLHKLGFTSLNSIEVLQQPFNSAFTAIIKLQIALKRGLKNQ
jgi:hypothetical protein